MATTFTGLTDFVNIPEGFRMGTLLSEAWFVPSEPETPEEIQEEGTEEPETKEATTK